MNIQIPYGEIEDYVERKYRQSVKLTYVNDNTFCVSRDMKVLFATKTVSINLSVIQVEGSDVTLSYQAGLGIELLVKGALAWFKEQMTGVVEESANNSNQLIVHLAEIQQLKKTFSVIYAQGVVFTQGDIKIQLFLR